VGDRAQIRRWQAVTLLLLFVGYSGYYLCRSNLSVVTPLLLDEMAWHGTIAEGALARSATMVSLGAVPYAGLSSGTPLLAQAMASYADARVHLGTIVSVSILAYALGKFIFGATGDLIGGRGNFLGGMTGAVLFTVLFALGGGLPVLTLAWVGNRFAQASGWPGLVKIGGRWFDYRWHGTALAVLSLSYLFGDWAAREFMGILLELRLGWRGVFFVNAGVLAAILAVCFIFLKESPSAIGAAEGGASPASVYGDREVPGLAAILRPLLGNRAFWYVCLLSLAMTFLRETFNNWTPDYFKSALGFTPASAARLSGRFMFVGGCSALAAGYLSDRFGRTGRAAILLAGLLLSGLFLFVLSGSGGGESPAAAVALVMATAFTLIGPYSYLAGAVALDFGGKQGSATACGIIDGVGYLGGAIAGRGVAELIRVRGWPTAWGVLSVVALAGCVAAALYWFDQAQTVPPGPEPEKAS
jgi:OPA family glycerol-3-phosphate transporter-like MFS transporter